MKKILFYLLGGLIFVACDKQEIDHIPNNSNNVIFVGFENDDTRIQLNEVQKCVWSKGDLVSVFYESDVNQMWEYRGETGERSANLYGITSGTPTVTNNRIVVVYPYKSNYIYHNDSGNIQVNLPTTQHYADSSYGIGDNLMVAQSETTLFSLKSVCGWLKLQLIGNGEKIKKIVFRGNNDEQLAGALYVNTATAESMLATNDDNIIDEITLDCGDGVVLNEKATDFYITIPPQTFENGITIDITDADGLVMTKSTNKSITIKRNYIQPMSEFIYEGCRTIANNEIWYTSSSTTSPTVPNKTNAFGDAKIISNLYDASLQCWVITFDKDIINIDDFAFQNCQSLLSITLPNSVVSIDVSAFNNCKNLVSVTLSDYITDINTAAFAYCTNLSKINLPKSLTTIPMQAFQYCRNILDITIPNSVSVISYKAFEYCDKLEHIIIPESITTIQNYAFNHCDRLLDVYCKSITPPSLGGTYVFDSNSNGRKIYVPIESIEAYKSASLWSEYADAIVGFDFENGVVVED